MASITEDHEQLTLKGRAFLLGCFQLPGEKPHLLATGLTGQLLLKHGSHIRGMGVCC
jgi:hypothetical protein